VLRLWNVVRSFAHKCCKIICTQIMHLLTCWHACLPFAQQQRYAPTHLHIHKFRHTHTHTHTHTHKQTNKQIRTPTPTGAKRSNLSTATLPGGAAPPHRPVPLIPEIDCVVHNYPLAPRPIPSSTTPVPVSKGRGTAAAAAAAAAAMEEGVWAEPVRAVPLVLRQMLNQQVLLANIRQAEAGGEQVRVWWRSWWRC